MAAAIGGSIGAAIGSNVTAGFLGLSSTMWTQIGWTAGVLLGNSLFSSDSTPTIHEGSKLNDLKVTSSTFGVPIPEVYGTYKISGNIIWALPLDETAHEQETPGKGGVIATAGIIGAVANAFGSDDADATYWYTYTATWAVALCEGPVDSIQKIWFDNVLVYNVDSDSPDQIENSTILEHMNIYLGDADQEVDWVIKEHEPDTPAYNNTVYIVIKDLPLADYGNRIPSITAEVAKSVTPVVQVYDPLTSIPTHTTPNSMILNKDSNYLYTIADAGTSWDYYGITTDGQNTLINSIVLAELPSEYDNATDTIPGFSDTNKFMLLEPGTSRVYLVDTDYTEQISNDPENDIYEYEAHIWEAYVPNMGNTKSTGNFYCAGYYSYIYSTVDNILYLMTDRGVANQVTCSPTQIKSGNTNISEMYVYNNIVYVVTTKPTEIEVSTYDSSSLLLIENYTVDRGGSYANEGTGLTIVDEKGIHIWKGNRYELIGLNNEIKTTFADIGTDMTDSNAYYKNGTLYKFTTSTNIAKFGMLASQTDLVSINSILYDLGLEAGLVDADMNFADGSAATISGYVRSRQMPARTAMQALLEVKNFFIYEDEFNIILKDQDSEPLGIIYEHEFGAGSDIKGDGNPLVINRKQQNDFIKKISIKYANKDAGYDPGIQTAQRIDTFSTNEVVIEYAVSITDDEAKALAELLLYSNWVKAETMQFALPIEYRYLKPGDIVTIIFKEYTSNVRLANITYTENSIIECEAVSEV